MLIKSFGSRIMRISRAFAKKGGDDQPEKKVAGYSQSLDKYKDYDPTGIRDMNIRQVNRSAKLYNKYEEYMNQPAQTKDKRQIQINILLRRHPIFLSFDKKLLEYERSKYKLKARANYIMSAPKELLQFEQESQYMRFKNLVDIYPTHESVRNGKKVFYRQNSKYFLHVDPNRPNDGGIQSYPCEHVFLLQKRQNKWSLPSKMLLNNVNMFDCQNSIIKQLFLNQEFSVQFPGNQPIQHIFKDYEPHERKRDEIGKVSFVFQAYHAHGLLNSDMERRWVPKQLLNQFMDREAFESLAGCIVISQPKLCQ